MTFHRVAYVDMFLTALFEACILTFGACFCENCKIALRSVTYKDGYYVNLLLTSHLISF